MFKRLFVTLVFCLFGLPVTGADLDMQRLDFLKAEQLLADKNSVEFLATLEKLDSYPLYPYLKAQWLKDHLEQTEQIKPFLDRFKDTRYANQVRLAWLDKLAEQQQWSDLLGYHQETDGTEGQCLYRQAQYLSGQKDSALAAAEQFWLSGEDLPAQCNFIISAFIDSPAFSQELVWRRFDLALQHNRVSLAQYLKGLLEAKAVPVADFWLQLHGKPELAQSPVFSSMPTNQQGAMLAYAAQRLVRKEPLAAVALWDARHKQLQIAPERHQEIEQKLALALANNKLPGAYARLMQVPQADDEVKEWRVRAALIDGNWDNVAKAVTSLGQAEQAKPKWQYWLARAHSQLGNKPQAEALFKQVAGHADYYGFLAADYLQSDYVFTNKPVEVLPELKEQLLASDAIKIVQELRHHHRDKEAQKQWWYIIKQLDKENIKAAAKLAQDWHWQQIAIFTLAKADYWDDLELRFPVGYEQSVMENASIQALDPMIIFGLIRQESAFDQAAASPVGARGLMQIMPATGSQIARELKEPWGSALSLFDPVVNIKYGAYYYKKLLTRFNGHFALAAAAYNAGPHRVDQWLAESARMPADVWVETIPFKETRKYVAAVLAYALIYQQRLQKEGLKMSNLMLEVIP